MPRWMPSCLAGMAQPGLTELLQPPHQHLEWRFAGPAPRQHRRGDRSGKCLPGSP